MSQDGLDGDYYNKESLFRGPKLREYYGSGGGFCLLFVPVVTRTWC
ncbi:hypothetical protein [Alistipes putredinis]